MNLSIDQLAVFLKCLFFGVTAGALYLPVYILRSRIKNGYVKGIIDVSAFVFITALYCCFACFSGFPSVRAYMLFTVLAGMIIICKSFHNPLAKVMKWAYNKIVKKTRKRKKTNDERQV